MPFIGSGQFQRIVGPYQGATLWQDQSIAEQAGGNLGPINPAYFDIQDQDFANGLSNCLTRDGQSTPTADIPMDGKKFTNVGNATAGDQFAVVSQLQSGVYTYGGTASGTANALILSVFPAITAYSNGMRIGFRVNTANTAATTVNINGVGIVPIRNWHDSTVELRAGELLASGTYELVYNSSASAFQLFNRLPKPDNIVYFGVATGTANAIIVTVPAPFPPLQDGLRVSFRATATNTANAVTVNVNGTGNIPLRAWNTPSGNPSVGEIQSGGIYELIYNAASVGFQFFNDPSGITTIINPTWTGAPYACSDGANVNASSLTYARYKRMPGNIVDLWIALSVTPGTANCNRITFTLPFSLAALGSASAGTALRFHSGMSTWVIAALMVNGTSGEFSKGVAPDVGLTANSEKFLSGTAYGFIGYARYEVA